MREICNKYRVNQVSKRSYPANFIEKTDEFINLQTGFGKYLIYQALPLVRNTVRGISGHIVVVSPLGKYERSNCKAGKYCIPAVMLSDISEENMRVVEREAFSVVYGSPEAWLKIDRWSKC